MADENKCNNDCENCDFETCPNEEADVVTLVDEETGEQFQFILVDNFDYKNKKYCVLVTLDDEDTEMIIAEEVTDENGEISIVTLGDEDKEVDEIYDYYDSLCDEYFEDLDDEDDEK